jgi:flavin reductase (DIM6/NTAB) family NADH-FMN oxidoreductase RutF
MQLQTDDRIRLISVSSTPDPRFADADPSRRLSMDAWLYRRTCAQFATGITVVTVTDSDGRPHGMTVNSFASVSLEPPLVLVSIDLRNAILGHFISTRSFAINILAEGQEDLSLRFSSTAENRFKGTAWHPGTAGMPILEGVLAHLECAVVRVFEAGDHVILIGEVRHADRTEGRPLLYFDSEYRRMENR